MGGEGANWIGEAPFSKRQHVFQNIGDGTYVHSGSLAIRAAIAAGTRITYKLLYNDAVAMTGGQKLDSAPTVGGIAAEMIAEGVERCIVVTDEPEKYPSGSLPAEVPVYHRRNLIAVEKELAALNGVTLLIYDQTCAAEKRRRRKRGLFPDPDKRAFINAAVCEGCGDCGVKSNCVAILPLETEFGRKRQIDQSACNKDFSCVEGFCPSFVTLYGAKPRRIKQSASSLPPIPEPSVVQLGERPYSIIVNGVGGTGVVTVSAVLAQAAHMAGLQFGAIDMTGMAQKGGAVACHIQIAGSSGAIHAIRVSSGGADLVLGGDLVVTASSKILDTLNADTSAVVCSTYEMITGDFARKPNLIVPGAELKAAILSRVRREAFHTVDAHDYAARLFGDTIMANMFLVGYAYQLGLLPIKADSIEEAIALNGAAVEANALAFRFGRLAAHDRAELDRIAHRELRGAEYAAPTLQDIVSVRTDHLTQYQNAALAERYRKRLAIIADIEATKTPGMSGLVEAVARGYHKLLAIKDEY
jgi:indolepyruvate ferredoxin oxidoreductase